MITFKSLPPAAVRTQKTAGTKCLSVYAAVMRAMDFFTSDFVPVDTALTSCVLNGSGRSACRVLFRLLMYRWNLGELCRCFEKVGREKGACLVIIAGIISRTRLVLVSNGYHTPARIYFDHHHASRPFTTGSTAC